MRRRPRPGRVRQSAGRLHTVPQARYGGACCRSFARSAPATLACNRLWTRICEVNTGEVVDGAARAPDPGPGGAAQREPGRVEPGIRTFLIADIRGYTSYTNERGDEAAAELAARFAAATEQIVIAHDGVVLELRGDEALAVFASARQAIRAAVALQRRYTQPQRPDELPLPVGIGLDAGEAVPVAGGFRGASLNLAARLCGLATAGQILATSEVVHLASRVDGTRFMPYGRVQLKGLTQRLEVIAITAEDSLSAPTKSGSSNALTRITARLQAVGLTGRRARFVILAVIVAIAVLAIAAVAPSLLPRQAESTSGGPLADEQGPTAPPPADLSATLVFVPDFEPKSHPPQYMVPADAGGPPDLPRHLEQQPAFTRIGSPQYNLWHERHGGVSEGRQTVRLVLNGQSDAPVIVTQIRPFVIERDPPLRGWQFLPEQGAGVSVRFVEASLDCPEHPALLIVPNPQTGQIARRTASIDLQVSRSDVEVLEVTVYSTRSYVRWGLEVTYVSRGEVSTLRVTDPRLRLTGQVPGTLRTYTPGAKGLVRTPQFDTTAETLRYLARSNARLCR